MPNAFSAEMKIKEEEGEKEKKKKKKQKQKQKQKRKRKRKQEQEQEQEQEEGEEEEEEEEKMYLESLVSKKHIRCHSNVSIHLQALVGKRRSHHSYGLWCKSKKNNSRRNPWNTFFFEQPPRLL